MGCISCAFPRFIRPTVTASPPLKLPTFRRCTVSAEPAPVYTCSRPSEREEISSPQLVSREYADLNLPDKFCEEVGHVRIRQHVNPLRSTLMVPVRGPDWNSVYKEPTLPLMVDIGSGSGRFLIWLAKRNFGLRNYLGLEIRPKLVKRSEYWVNELDLQNIHFIFANATVSFKQLVSTYPGPLVLVSILCPDPHFKKKHHKRRVVQKPLVESIVQGLVPGGRIFIQSDVLEVALEMRDNFDSESHKLVHIDSIDPDMLCDHEGWLLNNPMGIRTEREIHAELEGSRIFRRMYQKQCCPRDDNIQPSAEDIQLVLKYDLNYSSMRFWPQLRLPNGNHVRCILLTSRLKKTYIYLGNENHFSLVYRHLYRQAMN